jgi:NAD-dependent SIR2 family protein deacetylase
MGEATNVAGRTDLFFVIGSSLTVYPAASLPEYAGGQVVVVNQGPVEAASPEWLRIDEPADPFFARIASKLGL